MAFPAYIVTARRIRRTSLLIGFPRTLITALKPIIRLPACNELSLLQDHFRTTKKGLCLPEWPKTFSAQGSHKEMLTRYDIRDVLQSLAQISALLSAMPTVT